MSGLFGSVTIKGNRLTEFAKQAVSIGTPIPFGFGKILCDGNIIFAPMPPKEYVKKKKQGKGGVKTEEYTYTLSYAIAFCQGPIYGYWTIKRNGKIVWTQDPNASVDDRAYAAKWAQKATFYYGTETQLPDSTIESYKGAGRVSAFRGLAYIVVEDDDVTEGGGAVPTYEAIVIASPPEVFLTSKPYAIEILENVKLENVYGKASLSQFEDFTVSSFQPLVGKLNAIEINYVNWPIENISTTIFSLQGELKSNLISYSNSIPENLNSSFASLNGQLKIILFTYSNWPAENITVSFSPLTGTLQ